MKAPPFALAIITGLVLSLCNALAQDKTATPDRKTLEKQFEQTLKNATFKGYWSVTRDKGLSDPKPETYTIKGASKVGGDVWMIHARIQYGNKDVTVPIPVHVKWAGDTPVISITQLEIPGVGTYTARVVVYDNFYAGTWSGSNYGGVLSGEITRPQKPASPQSTQ